MFFYTNHHHTPWDFGVQSRSCIESATVDTGNAQRFIAEADDAWTVHWRKR
ncbi:hypothetical protein [Pseudomonas sp. LD120]|uniref:hypothetical protein n=1 Tax=Pseudomonas sp. LD120 TaxID=485751 RepID=UPI00135C55D3|nr:hypothetical protein [Pseudomonas sp. LD120]KAF0866467.1 hypothetical protein PLD_04030 [Pseudomonas sp. LD120]